VVVVVRKAVEAPIKLDNIPNLPAINAPRLRHTPIINKLIEFGRRDANVVGCFFS
jgi:hypothetical protein